MCVQKTSRICCRRDESVKESEEHTRQTAWRFGEIALLVLLKLIVVKFNTV